MAIVLLHAPCTAGGARGRREGDGMSREGVTLVWFLTRVATLALLVGYEANQGVIGDVNYFAHSLGALPHVGLAHTLVEYPLPAVAVLGVPYLAALALGSADLYPITVLASALVADAAFTVLLCTRDGAGRRGALWCWLLAVPLLGGVSLTRFDLLAGILVACTVLAAAQQPRLASVALAVAAAVKLWPVLVLPALVAAVRRRRDALWPFLALGVALAVVALVLAGWVRLFSPLTYQSDRGLQIESVVAAPAMLGWLVDPGHWEVRYSRFKAFEVSGPGTGSLLVLSDLLTLLLLAGLVLVWWRALSRREAPLTAEGLVWLTLASVSGFLVTAKVLSPQYLLWLLPVTAVALLVSDRRVVRRWAIALLVLTGLSHAVYPLLYRGLVTHSGESSVAVSVLVLRNLLLVALLVVAAHQAWQVTRTPAPVSDGGPASRQDLRRSSPSVG